MPIRDFINSLFSRDNSKLRVLILEYDNVENIGKFQKHISEKKTLRSLISKCDELNRVIVTFNNGENYNTHWDSLLAN